MQTEIKIWTLLPADSSLEKDFLAKLSPEAKYRRFFTCFNCPTPKQLEGFTLFDCSREQAFIAVTHENGKEIQVGVGRICQTSEFVCEFAVVVADEWQKQGIGFQLLKQLKDEAGKRGFKKIQGSILVYNGEMIELAKASGFQILPVPGDRSCVNAVYDLE